MTNAVSHFICIYRTAASNSVLHRPSGNLIASTQRKPHKHDVIFFERNGLQHGEFTLEEGGEGRGRKVHVRELQWSCDSTVLALWLETREQPEEQEQEKGEDGGRLSESYGEAGTKFSLSR